MNRSFFHPASLIVAGIWLTVTLALGCSDTILNPEQVIPTQGRHFQGTQLLENETVLTDSATGEPIRIVHVKLGMGSGGDGTYERPFGSVPEGLSAARARNIVLVHHGANPGIGDATVPAGVRLLSGSSFHFVNTREQGMVSLPLAGSSPKVTVTGTLTLGSDSEISGFMFVNEEGRGIVGRDINNVVLRENQFRKTGHQAIYLINTIGTVRITHNEIFGTQGGEFERACVEEFFSTGCPGLYIENHSGFTDLLIRRNTVLNTTGDGIKVVTTDEAQTVALIDSNTVRGTVGAGIKNFTLRQASLTTTVAYNSISQNVLSAAQDGGIRIGSFNTIVAFATVIGNEIINNRSNGIFIGTEDESDVTVTVLDNEILDNVGNGIFVGAQQFSTERGLVANNVVKRSKISNRAPGFPTGHGIFVGTLGSGTHEGTSVIGNRSNENETNGFFFAAFNAGKTTLNVRDNIAGDNGFNGMEFNVGLNIPPPGPDEVEPPLPPPGTTIGNFTVVNNTVSGNIGIGPDNLEGGGFTLLSFNGSILNIAMMHNRINNNGSGPGGFAGLGMLAFDNSRLNAGLYNNTLALNPASPGLNAQTLLAVAPALPKPGEFPRICLGLYDNVNDTGYLLNRPEGTEFMLDSARNVGEMIIQSLPLDPVGDCVVPVVE